MILSDERDWGERPVARRGASSKIEVLRAARTLNPRPEAVTDDSFAASGFLDPRDLLQVKYEMVRRVRVDGMTVSWSAG